MRLKAPPLVLLLLLLAAAELDGQNPLATGARPLRGSRSNGKYGMKLCGREFIRAVIFTCGGSRWKRLLGSRAAAEQTLGGGGEFVQSNSDKGVEDIKRQSALDPELEQLQQIGQPIEEQPLKILFHLYGDYNAYIPTFGNFSDYIHQMENAVRQSRSGPGLAKQMKSNNFPWVNRPRRKSDYSMGVAEMCCKWGCTKTEVSTLC